jgi:hypothetical protein
LIPSKFLNNIFNNFKKLYKTKISKTIYIIKNFEKIIQEKEKNILAKRKEILAKLRQNLPDLKKDIISAFCMGLLLGISCIFLAGYYGDAIDSKMEIMSQILPDPEKFKVFKWYKPLKYDFPYKTHVIKVQMVICWVFNDMIDVYNCPIDGLAPGISPDLYFNP